MKINLLKFHVAQWGVVCDYKYWYIWLGISRAKEFKTIKENATAVSILERMSDCYLLHTITHIVSSVTVIDVHLSLAVAKQDSLAVWRPLDVCECHAL